MLERLETAILKDDRKGATQAVAELQSLGPGVLPTLRDMACRTPVYEYARHLMIAICGLKHPDSARTLGAIYRGARGDNTAFIKKDAITYLAGLAGDASEAELIRLHQEEAEPALKEYILSRLKLVASPKTLREMGAPMTAEDRQREAAIDRTLKITRLDPRKDGDFDELTGIASNASFALAHRLEALARIESRGDDRAAASLLKFANEERDPQLRVNVLAAVARLGSGACRDWFKGCLGSPQEPVRLEAAKALAFGSPGWALQLLSSVENDSSERVRAAATASRNNLQIRLARNPK